MKHSRITLLSTLMLLMHCGSIFSATENAKIAEPATWLDEMHKHNHKLRAELSEIDINLKKYDNCYIGTGTKAVMCGLFAAGTLIAGGRESCQSGREKIKMALVGGFIVSGFAFSYYYYHTHCSRELLFRQSAINDLLLISRGMEHIFTQLPNYNAHFAAAAAAQKAAQEAQTKATTAAEKVTAFELAITQITQTAEKKIAAASAQSQQTALAMVQTAEKEIKKIADGAASQIKIKIQLAGQQAQNEIAAAATAIVQANENEIRTKILKIVLNTKKTIQKVAEEAITAQKKVEEIKDETILITQEAKVAAQRAKEAQEKTEFAAQSIHATGRELTTNYSQLNFMVNNIMQRLGINPASFTAQ